MVQIFEYTYKRCAVNARDQTVPHNHKQALFIYSLEPSYMSGSHWVATYVKDAVINY